MVHALHSLIAPVVIASSLLAACSSLVLSPEPSDAEISPKDGANVRFVPGGTLAMGNDAGWAGQKPVHDVQLSAFWIDETEVTNRMYAFCVEEGGCRQPIDKTSYTRDPYFENPAYEAFPVIHVSWEDADAYCRWAGRRLPTEPEWEMAARGIDGRLYPWGNQLPTPDLLNSFEVSFLDDTVPVGSYPEGASPFGALDMAGNVWEWTSDWFNPYPGGDPAASESYGEVYKVLRGGSFVDAADATTRYPNDPTLQTHDIGFRCATGRP
jgi:formylglycine-generating enzyme required for sulfatase activity